MDNNSCRNTTFKDSSTPATDIITRCLTIDCKSCLGSYSNEVLGHRFICKCECHDPRGNTMMTQEKGQEQELGVKGKRYRGPVVTSTFVDTRVAIKKHSVLQTGDSPQSPQP